MDSHNKDFIIIYSVLSSVTEPVSYRLVEGASMPLLTGTGQQLTERRWDHR